MKNRGTFLRRVLGLALVLAVLLPLAGNGMVLESSAVTQAQASVKFVGLAHHPQRVKSVLCPPPLLSVH